jgi:hypothetical protein
MANEVTASAVFQVNSGTYLHLKQLSQTNQDIGALTVASGVMLVPDASTAIPLGDVSAPGWAYFKNLSTDTPIEVGNSSGGLIRLQPGQFAGPMPLGAAPYAQADTTGAQLEYYIVEAEVEGT